MQIRKIQLRKPPNTFREKTGSRFPRAGCQPLGATTQSANAKIESEIWSRANSTKFIRQLFLAADKFVCCFFFNDIPKSQHNYHSNLTSSYMNADRQVHNLLSFYTTLRNFWRILELTNFPGLLDQINTFWVTYALNNSKPFSSNSWRYVIPLIILKRWKTASYKVNRKAIVMFRCHEPLSQICSKRFTLAILKSILCKPRKTYSYK